MALTFNDQKIRPRLLYQERPIRTHLCLIHPQIPLSCPLPSIQQRASYQPTVHRPYRHPMVQHMQSQARLYASGHLQPHRWHSQYHWATYIRTVTPCREGWWCSFWETSIPILSTSSSGGTTTRCSTIYMSLPSKSYMNVPPPWSCFTINSILLHDASSKLYFCEGTRKKRNGAITSPFGPIIKFTRSDCEVATVWMNEMPRFFIICKYDWFISQRTSQIQICSKLF